VLVRLFDIEVPSPWRYYLVYPPSLAQSPKLAVFRQWVRDEIERDAQMPQNLGSPRSAAGRKSRTPASPRARS
jgi:LysR family glycine cleavage system transcriptional activator